MKITHTFKGMLTNEEKTITEDNAVSPTSGYTQRYAEESGKSYEKGRAEDLLGDHDFWIWESSSYAKN